jgi:CRISPR-associated protein Cas5t
MLLSLVGVDWPDKARFAGVRMALAIEGEPELSRVFRKLRRVPQSNKKADPLTSRRPDYQDLLIGLRLWIWLQDGVAVSSLIERISAALAKPSSGTVHRYGGLCLGESSQLVNEVSIRSAIGSGRFLCRDQRGYHTLPVWVHHPRCGQGKTRMERFSILELDALDEPAAEDARWISIQPMVESVKG